MATPDIPPLWLSTSQAGAVLGISARAVQKRCTSGTLAARRVAIPGGFKWEVDGRELDPRTSEPTPELEGGTSELNRAEARNLEGETGALHAHKARNLGRNLGTGTPELEGGTGKAQAPDFTAHLIEENRFLRATVEQHQRSEAELRAALREALRVQPRALEAGTPATPPDATQTRPATKDADAPSSAQQTPAGARETGLTYGDIADELERKLNR